MHCYSIVACIYYLAHAHALLVFHSYIGISAAFIWTAAGVYLTRLAHGYSKLVEEDPSSIIPKFNGSSKQYDNIDINEVETCY